MIRHKHHHSPWQVFADMNMLFFAWAISIVMLLIISYNLQVNKKGDIVSKAEVLITATWDRKRDVDVDMWMEIPSGHVIMYTNKEDVNISLDRDSRGMQTNSTILPDGSHSISINQEIITIRAIVPGDYLVAISYYGGTNEKTGYNFQPGQDTPDVAIEVQLEVDKVNPKFTQVHGALVTLTKVKQTLNVLAFHIDNNGNFTILPLPEEDMIHRVTNSGPQHQ